MSLYRSTQLIKNGLGLRELRAVLAVAELGSFRRAAAELGYTQSALSHQVAALEAALGWPLFDRPGGRAQVRLTPAGEAVCQRARRVLAEVEAVAADAEQAARGESIRVRVGVTQSTASEIMPAALRAFRDDHPSAEVVLSAADDPEVSRAALRRGDLDFAFSFSHEADEFTETVPVVEDPWVILTRRDSPIADLREPGFDVLHELDLVAWSRRWAAQVELEEAWQRRGIAPRIVYRTDDNLALQRLVAAGLGHACIGRLAASRAIDPALTWLAPAEQLPPRTIVLCYPRHRPLTATARSLITAIRAQAGLAERLASVTRSYRTLSPGGHLRGGSTSQPGLSRIARCYPEVPGASCGRGRLAVVLFAACFADGAEPRPGPAGHSRRGRGSGGPR